LPLLRTGDLGWKKSIFKMIFVLVISILD
jgi:hypothetical protein